MTDRNMSYGENTVFWKDFINFFLNTQAGNLTDMGQLLNRELVSRTESGEINGTYDLSYLPRSIIKLESLGVLQYDFITTLGTTSPTYIDRFHLTFFGQKVLEYIDANKQD